MTGGGRAASTSTSGTISAAASRSCSFVTAHSQASDQATEQEGKYSLVGVGGARYSTARDTRTAL
jgi:hypothetical protein